MPNINTNKRTFKCKPASYPFQPHCYETHLLDIKKVCHHCGRAMSDNAPILGSHWFPWLYSNTEFIGLEGVTDSSLSERVIHCKHCQHEHIRYQWIIILFLLGIMFLFISIWIAFQPTVIEQSFIPWHIVLIAAGFVFFLFTLWSLYDIYQDIAHYPLFPVIGTNPEISINEVVKGNITLDPNGNYEGEISHRSGTLTYKVWQTPKDNKRYSYIGKPRTSAEEHAGFILLESSMDLQFEDSISEEQPNVIKLESSLQRGGTNWIWRKDVKFNPRQAFGGTNRLPIQIVPIVVPQLGKEGRARSNGLELTVQITPEFMNSNLTRGEIRIINLEIRADQKLGSTESVYPAEAQRESKGFPPFVKWNHIPLEVANIKLPHKTFSVRYNGSIEQEMVFMGSVTVEFNRSISGIKNVRLFYPTGCKRDLNYCEYKTVVIANFEIHLQKWVIRVPYTDLCPVPGGGLLPDHKMVNQIIRTLSSNSEYYVQRVIENPPHTNKADAHIINRLWDIGGRWYDKLYPISFHIVVTGKEVYEEGKDTAKEGETRFDVTLQTTTISHKVEENGVLVEKNELEDKVKEVRENIKKTIENIIEEAQKEVTDLNYPLANGRVVSSAPFPLALLESGDNFSGTPPTISPDGLVPNRS